MKIRRGEWLLIVFNLAYIIPFAIYFISIANLEFMWYIGIMIALIALVVSLHVKFKFSYPVLWGLSIWGLLHMAGGGVRTADGVVLYGLKLIPIWVTENFYVLRYDQAVHFYLYFVMVFVLFALIKGSLGKQWNPWITYAVVMLASIGISALNEVAEFIPVLLLRETGVGGYYNNSWDLVSNSIGAFLGMVVLIFMNKRAKRKSY